MVGVLNGKAKAVSFVVVAFLLCGVFGGLVTEQSVAVDYSLWRYYKLLTVTNSSALPSGYQVNFTVWSGVGADSANNFYLNNHGAENYADLRFVDGDGNLLDMWNESSLTVNHVHVWIELVTSRSVVLYYGYAGASSHWGSSSSVFERVISSDVVLALPLNEGSGSVIHDYSEFDNDGVLTNGHWISSGKWGTALNFTGDDYVTVSDDSSLDLVGNVTILAYVNSTAAAAGVAGIVSKDNLGIGDGYSLSFASGVMTALEPKMRIGGTWEQPTSNVILANTEYSVAAVYNGSMIMTWVNGVEWDAGEAASGAVSTNNRALQVGHWDGGGAGTYLIAEVSGVYLFSANLSAAVLLDLYNYYPQCSGDNLGSLFLREYVSGTVETDSGGQVDSWGEVADVASSEWLGVGVSLFLIGLSVLLAVKGKSWAVCFLIGLGLVGYLGWIFANSSVELFGGWLDFMVLIGAILVLVKGAVLVRASGV